MDAAPHVTLSVSPQPDSLLRVSLGVRPLPAPLSVPSPPVPEPFAQTGFTVVEWGVLLLR
jgi:hypothetical protein